MIPIYSVWGVPDSEPFDEVNGHVEELDVAEQVDGEGVVQVTIVKKTDRTAEGGAQVIVSVFGTQRGGCLRRWRQEVNALNSVSLK